MSRSKAKSDGFHSPRFQGGDELIARRRTGARPRDGALLRSLVVLGSLLGLLEVGLSEVQSAEPAAQKQGVPGGNGEAPVSRPLVQAIVRAEARSVKIYGGKVGREPGFGTGMIVAADGRILTVNSTLLLGERIQVVLPDGSRHPAKVLRRSPERSLALLQIPVATPAFFNLTAGATARQGDWVLAVNNAFNVAQGREKLSITLGVLSLRTSLDTRRGGRDYDYAGEALILDAITSNPGASGGAVVDVEGRLAGMLGKVIESQSTGTRLNYAIPTEVLYKFVNDKSEAPGVPAERTDEAELGLRLFSASDPHAAPYVDRVISGSPAAAAGLQPDDLILELADQNVRSVADYKQVLQQLLPGKAVVLSFKRKNDVRSVQLTPTARAKKAMP